MSEQRVNLLAARQHGLVSRRQALAYGMTGHQVENRVATGRWLPLRRGVYSLAGAPAGYEQSVHAACLAVGLLAVASHLTAGVVWGLTVPPPEAIDVLTPLGGPRARLEGVRQHRTRTSTSTR